MSFESLSHTLFARGNWIPPIKPATIGSITNAACNILPETGLNWFIFAIIISAGARISGYNAIHAWVLI